MPAFEGYRGSAPGFLVDYYRDEGLDESEIVRDEERTDNLQFAGRLARELTLTREERDAFPVVDVPDPADLVDAIPLQLQYTARSKITTETQVLSPVVLAPVRPGVKTEDHYSLTVNDAESREPVRTIGTLVIGGWHVGSQSAPEQIERLAVAQPDDGGLRTIDRDVLPDDKEGIALLLLVEDYLDRLPAERRSRVDVI